MNHTQPFSFSRVLVYVILASLVNIMPMRLFDAGGDSMFHFMLIECFSSQFWQGDVYPRWCMEANSGLGVPVFLFYFPLPYYVAALLYPLTDAGVSMAALYTLSMFLATVVTGITAYLWLSDITERPRALMVSIALLFMPYRMEAMLFRAGYAEMWAMALLPLMFMYTRRLVLGKKEAMAGFALASGACLITHVPLTIVAYIICGLYAVIAAEAKWPAMVCLKLAGIGGAAIASFYLFPGFYFRRFMLPPSEVDEPTPWANSFLSMQNLSEQGRVVAGSAMAMGALALFAIYLLIKRSRIEDKFMCREVWAWAAASIIAALLLFPISAPLYDALKPWSGIVFPWRMQAIFMFATAFMMAVWMCWFVLPRKLKTWKGDYGMFMVLLVLLSYFMVGIRNDDEEGIKKVTDARLIAEPEYRTQWTDKKYFNDQYFFDRLKKTPPQVEIISGKGKVEVKRWGWDGITLESESADKAKPVTVRLDHSYFPLWHVKSEGGVVMLKPEKDTGRMLVEIPAGKQAIELTYCTSSGDYKFIWVFNALSGLVTVVCLWKLSRRKIASLALTKRH
jgi:hypothetical protein